jgi:hypothetical protein
MHPIQGRGKGMGHGAECLHWKESPMSRRRRRSRLRSTPFTESPLVSSFSARMFTQGTGPHGHDWEAFSDGLSPQRNPGMCSEIGGTITAWLVF